MPLTPLEKARLSILEDQINLIQQRMLVKSEEKELELCKRDPWYWFQKYVYTIDETDLENPIKKFPDFEYCQDLVRCWQMYPQYRLWLIEKSRRMLVTLTIVGLLLHDAQFFDGHMNFIVSQNEPKAAKQIERRAAVMYSNQPDFIRIAYPAKATYCYMTFFGQNHNISTRALQRLSRTDHNNSKSVSKVNLRKKVMSEIWSMPQLGEQVRGETPSNVLFDEIVAQSMAESNYNALSPALEPGQITHGPRFWGVSTAGEGFFDRAIHDVL